MRKMLYLMFLNMGLLLICSAAFAQETIVRGRITGASNEPLQGVSVSVKGTSRSVVTDATGNYSIKASKGEVLIFTNVGFQKKEVTVSGSTINAAMDLDSKSMENVVVTTALGIQKTKRSLGFSTQEVKGEEVAQTQRENFLNALQGRVAGATVNA